PSTWPDNRDWFAKLADFAGGVADGLTNGLTSRIRKALDIDGVDYNSSAYAAGQTTGQVMNTVLENVTPCGKALRLAVALKGLSAANGVGSALNAQEALENGDILGFMDGTMGAYAGFNKLGQSCFTAGTPLLTPDGSKPIEQFREGDLILSR